MLNNIRNFSKTIFAKILLVIIIIPFVFWGMGGMFNSGNTNNIVKINNQKISTQDFMDYLNKSKLTSDFIKENIKKNIIEDLLSELVSIKILEMEIQELKISMSDKSLVQKIKKNQNFLDDNNKFSRIKYEKFLLSQNYTAPGFESILKRQELKKKLFSYISGGIKSPSFLVNKKYKEQTAKLEIEYINLEYKYKKENFFSKDEIKKFVNDNSENLKEEYLDFSYVKITPLNLTGTNDFNELFFKKIDEIENSIANGLDFNTIVNELKLNPVKKSNYIIDEKINEIEDKIYKKRNETKIQLIDENEYYILYTINEVKEILPSLDNQKFTNKVNKILYKKNKYEYIQSLLEKINTDSFNQINFKKLSENNIEKLKISSIKDDKKFSQESVKLLYDQPVNGYALVADIEKNVYIAKITKLDEIKINKTSKDFTNYKSQTNIKLRDNLYSSYDNFLSNKYEIVINQKTLDRVKNYFE